MSKSTKEPDYDPTDPFNEENFDESFRHILLQVNLSKFINVVQLSKESFLSTRKGKFSQDERKLIIELNFLQRILSSLKELDITEVELEHIEAVYGKLKKLAVQDTDVQLEVAKAVANHGQHQHKDLDREVYTNTSLVKTIQGVYVDKGHKWHKNKDIFVLIDEDQYLSISITNKYFTKN